MTPIAHFEPHEDDQGNETCPNYLIVRANRVTDRMWAQPKVLLAVWDPVSGFFDPSISGNDACLHNVTHFFITELPIL